MERTLYLWCSSEKKVTVDLHLVALANRDGAYVVLVAQLLRRRLQSTCTSSSLRMGMDHMLYLWRGSKGEGCSRPAPRCPCRWRWSAHCICSTAPKDKVAVDLYLVVLVDRDGAHIVLVAQLRRRRLQLTCTSSSLRIGMERTLYLWRSSEGEGCSRPAPRRPCG